MLDLTGLPTKSKIEAIARAPIPGNKTELELEAPPARQEYSMDMDTLPR